MPTKSGNLAQVILCTIDSDDVPLIIWHQCDNSGIQLLVYSYGIQLYQCDNSGIQLWYTVMVYSYTSVITVVYSYSAKLSRFHPYNRLIMLIPLNMYLGIFYTCWVSWKHTYMCQEYTPRVSRKRHKLKTHLHVSRVHTKGKSKTGQAENAITCIENTHIDCTHLGWV